MKKTNKVIIIEDFVSYAGIGLLNNGYLEISVCIKGEIEINTNAFTCGEFAILRVDEAWGELLFNFSDKKYYYSGEPRTEPCLGGRKVEFELTKELVSILPEIIIDYFERVSKNRVRACIEISNWTY